MEREELIKIIEPYAQDKVHLAILSLEYKGYSDAKIADLLNMKQSNFCVWRKSKGYKRVYHYRKVDRGKLIEDDVVISNTEYMRRYRKLHPEKFGYDVMRVSNGHEHVSRLVASVCLDRPLDESEVVHHRDGDVSNNSKGNLFVFANQGDHLAYHKGKDVEFVELKRSRVSGAEKRAKSREYRKAYYKRNNKKEEKLHYCKYCREIITPENYGLKAMGEYACKVCSS